MDNIDHLGAILSRFKNGTMTDSDLEILEQLGHSTEQTVEQTGKFNVNFGQGPGQGSIQIGDRGFSPQEVIELVREIVRILSRTQSLSTGHPSPTEQPLNDELLTLAPIAPDIIEQINHRLATIQELQTAGQLSIEQQTEFTTLKNTIHSVKGINQELETISERATQIIQEAIKSLVDKLRELKNTQGENLQDARSQVCLQQQIEPLQQFHTDLENGRVTASWLQRQQQPLAQQIGESALDAYPQIKNTLSPQELNDFQFSVEQFLDQLSHCLTWGRTNSLDNLAIPVVLDDAIYIAAFEHLKILIPSTLPNDGIEQLKEYIDYLITRLPNYPHGSMNNGTWNHSWNSYPSFRESSRSHLPLKL